MAGIKNTLDLDPDESESPSESKSYSGTNSYEVSLVGGNQTINFNNAGGNVAYVPQDDDTERGTKVITFTNGSNLAVVDNKTSTISITAGAGNDTLVAQDKAPITFDLSKSSGADKIVARYGDREINISIKGYKASLGGGIVTGADGLNALIESVKDGAIKFGDGRITIKGSSGGKGKFDFDNSNATGYTLFNLFDKNNEQQAVGFTHTGGGTLNVSTSGSDYLLVGNYFEDRSTGSTLIGGTGDDTLLAGSEDVLNAGAGRNQIIFNDDYAGNRSGATIILSTGRTTIEGLNNSFDETQGDTIQVDINSATVSYDTEAGALFISGDGFKAQATVNAEDGGYITQQFKSGSQLIKAAIAASAETTIDASSGANYYQGNKSAVNFANVEGAVNVDLSGNSSIDGTAATFKGISVLQAGEYDTTLRGSDANETLYAGIGDSTLYGAGGRNVLVGTADDSASDGRTTFLVLGANNAAQNTIQGFQFADDVEDNSLADVFEIGDNIVSNVFIRNNTDVVMDVSNSAGTISERAVVQNAVGKNMYVTDNVVAQVNTTSLNYDGAASFFVATGKNASITVDGTKATSANIWLGNQSVNHFVGDIRTIDARGFDGKAELAGGDNNETIYGGANKNSLWGGNGGDDLMVGGAGQNLFFFTNGNGNDTISGTQDGDVVILSEVSLEQISGTNYENGVVTINFTDGGKLTVNDAENVTFMTTQGDQSQTYKVNQN